MEKVTIIGAGIGGLTLAIALQRKGISFEIYESFRGFKDLGAGIMLANNTMQVYKALGIDSDIAKEGYPFKALNITTKDLSILSRIATDQFSEVKIPSFAIHRSSLQKVLINQIPSEKLHLGKKLKSLSKIDGIYQLVFEDGTSLNASIIIGADGIHSQVRKEVNIKTEERSASQMCWRGIVNFKMPKKFYHELFEVWDEGKRFGCVQISEDKVYWYALESRKSKAKITKYELLQLFKNYTPLVHELISNTDENVILNNEIKDIKPINNWYKGGVCLIGDAAHATTPNMGQGACQSIEDALVLARELSENKEVEIAFKKYQNYRLNKANKVITTSWTIGKVSHYKNPVSVALRNFMIKVVPMSMMKKQNEFLYNI